ncbi:hypothetical protein [Streptomyces sp. NPDC059893]|uniref:hypothetical protein n=1 Tax=Streptomyces sp. NPDC059893 TaxID=3346990 RepID=UPI00365B8BFD
MPILDFSADHTWFVMPWAEATAEDRQEQLREPAQLRALVNALASVLDTAHEHDWLHRDIKPSNILCLKGRWTLAGSLARWLASLGHRPSGAGPDDENRPNRPLHRHRGLRRPGAVRDAT